MCVCITHAKREDDSDRITHCPMYSPRTFRASFRRVFLRVLRDQYANHQIEFHFHHNTIVPHHRIAAFQADDGP